MDGNNEKRIKVTKDGPYLVTGNVPINEQRFVPNQRGFSLSYEEINTYPEQETYNLCRCGKSKTKPYCDGSHLKGFDGTETAGHKKYRDMAKFIEGKQINMLDAPELCAYARFCDTKSGAWNLTERAENPEARDIVIYQCSHCPSGRLTAVTKEGEILDPALPQGISALDDPAKKAEGPLWVKGGIVIEDEHGQEYEVRNRVTLCRCGKSKNKPFCDGAHLHKENE